MDCDITFEELLDFSYTCQVFLSQALLDKFIQLVDFHPDLIFEGSDIDDPTNYVNRSPYPIIHLLRTEEVADAIKSFGDIDTIITTNIDKTSTLGGEYLAQLFRSFQS